MSRRAARRRDSADTALADTFRRNAATFHQAALAAMDRHSEITWYFLAIAIELLLKAHLLHRGISDDWNRIHIRHDLIKALKCARRAGFAHAPVELPALATLLSPYYEAHAVSVMPPNAIASVRWFDACETVALLIIAVSAGLQSDAPGGPSNVTYEVSDA